MAVFRVEKNANYSVMANYHFRDKTLSWKAKGILSNMLSLPDDWDYSLAGLETLASDGMSATRSAIKELEEHGYLVRKPIREGGRIRDWEYVIFECPQKEKQQTEILLVENPQVENSTQLNTEQSSTDVSSIKQSNTRKKDIFSNMIIEYSKGLDISIRAEVADLLLEWLNVRKAKRAAMTEKAISLNLQKLDKCVSESRMSITDYLKEVICRGWQAFYPIKNYNTTAQKQGGGIMDDYERMNEIIDDGGLF